MSQTNMTPPVVKVDVDNACHLIWGLRPLGRHIADLERLLMIDVDAPVSFDGIPLRSSSLRSKAVVDVVSRSMATNPALRPLVQRIGVALKADRVERLGHPVTPVIEEAVEKLSRQVEVKSSYRPRG